MKGSKSLLTFVFCAFGMFVMILDSAVAVKAAGDSIQICLGILLPSLFPFIFLSVMLTGCISSASTPFLRPLRRLLRVPQGAETLWLIGILGGYPVGAQCVGQAYAAGRLSRPDATRMLGFCSNCGPAFIFGVLSAFFSDKWILWILWLIHILSSIITACCLPGNIQTHFSTANTKITVTDAMKRSVFVMAQLCGWVILFRILIAFLERWFVFFLSETAAVALSGILELANGCIRLEHIPNIYQRFILCSAMLAWGGLCVLMQTWSVVPSQLHKRTYVTGKLLQMLVSVILSCAVFYEHIGWIIPLVLFVIFMIAVFILNKSKIEGRNLQPSIVL